MNSCWFSTCLKALHIIRYGFGPFECSSSFEDSEACSSFGVALQLFQDVLETDFGAALPLRDENYDDKIAKYISDHLLADYADVDFEDLKTSFPETNTESCKQRHKSMDSYHSAAIWEFYHHISAGYAVTCERYTEDVEGLCARKNNGKIVESLMSVVQNIFACAECQEHFAVVYNDFFVNIPEEDVENNIILNSNNIPYSHIPAMWLWRVHNIVNFRVSMEDCHGEDDPDQFDWSSMSCEEFVFPPDSDGSDLCGGSSWLVKGPRNKCTDMTTIDPLWPAYPALERESIFLSELITVCPSGFCAVQMYDDLIFNGLTRGHLSADDFLSELDQYLISHYLK